jgi:hypothetical protein
MQLINVSSVLRQKVACDLYSNLVTRTTGAAVRGQIELLLRESAGRRGESGSVRALTVIDFSQVSMIDFSCADEVVAKLLLRYAGDDPPQDAYFLFRGVTEDHWDAIEAVLERHGLALALEEADEVRVVGVLSDGERRAWEAAYRLGGADVTDVAAAIDLDPVDTEEALTGLCRRRLMMRVEGRYVAVGSPRG